MLVVCTHRNWPKTFRVRQRAHYAIGHYYTYSGAQPFGRLVYPTAEQGGLGVHVTLDLGGQVKFGPDVRWIDSVDYTFDDSKRADFADAIRAYYPGLDEERLQPGYTGIRPKIDGPGGAADFLIRGPRIMAYLVALIYWVLSHRG